MSVAIIQPYSKVANVCLPKIKALLHDVFIKEQKWNFSQSNPSGIRIENKNQFTDNFMDNATWVVYGNNLDTSLPSIQAACRIIELGPVEVAGYARKHDTMAISKVQALYGSSGLVELNRLVVARSVRSSKILSSTLLPAALKYLAEKENDERPLMFTIPLNLHWYIKGISAWMDMERFGEPFYYEEMDSDPAQMFITQRSTIKKMFEYNTTGRKSYYN